MILFLMLIIDWGKEMSSTTTTGRKKDIGKIKVGCIASAIFHNKQIANMKIIGKTNVKIGDIIDFQ